MVDTTRRVHDGLQMSATPRHVAAATGLSAGAALGAGLFGESANELDEHSQPAGIATTRPPIERVTADRHFGAVVA